MIPSFELEASCAARKTGDISSWSRNGTSEEAFVELFGSRIQRMVVGALWQFRLRPEEVGREDLLQEVYCRVFERGLKIFEGMAEAQVVLYLKRVVRSTLVSRLRADRALKRGGDWTRDRAPVWQLVDLELTPEGDVLEREAREELLDGCRWLAAQGRYDERRNARILTLVLAGGWTSREVSADFEGRLSPSSVDSLLWRSRQKLEAEEGTEPAQRDLPESIHNLLRLALDRRSRACAC